MTTVRKRRPNVRTAQTRNAMPPHISTRPPSSSGHPLPGRCAAGTAQASRKARTTPSPQADPDHGATALVGWGVHVDIGATIPQDQADPNGHPGAEVEPKQEDREGVSRERKMDHPSLPHSSSVRGRSGDAPRCRTQTPGALLGPWCPLRWLVGPVPGARRARGGPVPGSA